MVLISCDEELHVSNTKRILILATVLQVTMLDNAANLYKTAGAAWCIALATLFHLCLNVITNDPESLTLMKERMKDRLKERNTCKETEGGGGEEEHDPNQEAAGGGDLEAHQQFPDVETGIQYNISFVHGQSPTQILNINRFCLHFEHVNNQHTVAEDLSTYLLNFAKKKKYSQE